MFEANRSITYISTLKTTIKHIPALVPLAKSMLRIIKFFFRSIELFIVLNQLFFYLFIKKIEYYQPLYNFSLFNYLKPQRTCIDRADAIFKHIQSWGQGARILDIGCNLGYFSYYFAERGYVIDGIDSNVDNISICNLINRLNNRDIHFFTHEFSNAFLEKISSHQYDMVFLFSVLHHISYHYGFTYAQDLAAKLLNKIPVLLVELAIKNEENNASWRNCLPDNELEIFAKCTDITIEKIGFYPNHLSPVRRPLYLIKKNTMEFIGVPYRIYDRKFTSYMGAKYIGRYYYDCGEIYIKKYFIQKNTNSVSEILQEIDNYQRLPENDFFPSLLDHEEKENNIVIILKKLPGENLHNLLIKGKPVPALNIFKDIINALDFLWQNGLYHNDIRLWNVMFDDKKAYLLDLGFASVQEKENTNVALLWIIAQLHHFNYYDFYHPITTPPNIVLDDLQPHFKEIVNKLQKLNDFTQFLEWFNLNSPAYITH